MFFDHFISFSFTSYCVIPGFLLSTISGLQVTDVNHDARISALEENGGSGSQNSQVLFYISIGTIFISVKTVEITEVVDITNWDSRRFYKNTPNR